MIVTERTMMEYRTRVLVLNLVKWGQNLVKWGHIFTLYILVDGRAVEVIGVGAWHGPSGSSGPARGIT